MHILDPNIKGWSRFETEYFSQYVLKKTKIVPTTLFEIGCSNGSDAETLRKLLNIDPKNVFCFEPNHYNYQRLINSYKDFNSYEVAVSDITGKTEFRSACITDISSLRERCSYPTPTHTNDIKNFNIVTTDVIRMDDFINNHNIESVDVCKIDVEGCTYEVLHGFGNKLDKVKSFQLEGELVEVYKGQKLFNEDVKFLTSKGYALVGYHVTPQLDQCDSVWVKNEYLL